MGIYIDMRMLQSSEISSEDVTSVHRAGLGVVLALAAALV